MTATDTADAFSGTTLSPETIEGRLMAHRTVLALILAHLQRDGGALDLMALLDSLSVMQDSQEDPGAEVSGLDVVQGAIAEEIAATVLASSPEKILTGEGG